MVATVIVQEWNGASGSPAFTDKTAGNVRFKTADDASGSSTTNPISVPAAGSNWSYRKYVRLKCTVAPATQLSNITAYSDGAIGWTGCTFWAKNTASYATPALETASTGYTSMQSYTSGSPLNLSVTSTGPYTTTGDIGDFLQSALEVTSAAGSGTLATETITWAFLEV